MIPVMIVEDEFLVRTGLKSSIDWEEEGFEIVAEARDGLEALEKYQKYRPSIVITDIRLPKMDGIAMMKELRRQDEEISFIVVSAYSDFHYARESICVGVVNYFLKGDLDTEELLSTLKSLRQKYRREGRQGEGLYNMTMCELYRNPEFLMMVSREWKKKLENCYLLYFDVKETNQEILELMVTDFFLQNDICYMKLKSDHGSWFLYGKEGEDSFSVTDKLSNMFHRYVDETVVLICSRELSGYLDMKEAIYHVLLLRENRQYPNEQQKNCGQEREVFSYVQGRLRQLREYLKFQQYEKACEVIEQIRHISIESGLPSALFMGVYRVLGMIADCDEKIVAAKEYEGLMESMNIDGIFQTLINFLLQLKEKRDVDSNIYVLRVKEYVQKNYHKPIRIRDLSDYIHVSPNYLGKIFYLHTGEYLKNYVNSIKMEKARELICTQKYHVSEVAELVGIEDQRYFSKLFRKYYGMSPKEYGKNLL